MYAVGSRSPEQEYLSLWVLIQGSEQVWREQRGHVYTGGEEQRAQRLERKVEAMIEDD